ncbi:ABC transporter ATP-binding protein [Labrys wisconsinensis]|uniref:ABC-type branched-subunit amino acid transport system ATPase component n=1 Tax=Labrys wisconsinensis TaxID=425677 RepID=A0ABU0J4M8_9HYPH|nr:ABC transporter ATP-binding protein [Labrys wisconsinensis]MDQ0469221.1 ABC-type branched-subunit amino acid transport system ATPase component [Labrys wisconsinensis]
MSGFLAVDGLRVAYERDIEILRGVDLGIEAGGLAAIIGPNGAGKSTLLKAVAGLAPVVGGTTTFLGARIDGLSPPALRRLGIAFVAQEDSVFPEMSVRENLRLGGWVRRKERAWLDRRIEECAALFPAIVPHLDRRAGLLSGGQRKLVEVARGLVAEPKLLLLDEPTAGLSPAMVRELYRQLARLKQAGISILLVEQNVREALEVADHVYVLAMGLNDVDGPAREISRRLPEIVQGWLGRKMSGLVA